MVSNWGSIRTLFHYCPPAVAPAAVPAAGGAAAADADAVAHCTCAESDNLIAIDYYPAE